MADIEVRSAVLPNASGRATPHDFLEMRKLEIYDAKGERRYVRGLYYKCRQTGAVRLWGYYG